MPENRPLTFDHEATLEELTSVGKNRRFAEVIAPTDGWHLTFNERAVYG